VPLVVALYDYYVVGRKEKDVLQASNLTIFYRVKLKIVYGRLRHVYVAFFVAWGSYLSVCALSSVDTTYICPTSLSHTKIIPLYQWIGALLDGYLLVSSEKLLRPDPGHRPGDGSRGPAAWGLILLVSFCLVHKNGFWRFGLTSSRFPLDSGPSSEL
jgi:hypothetical protein